MAEVLDCREPHPAAYDINDLNNSFRTSSHLPRINLPIFDRSFDNWESFLDKFKSIHDEQTLTNIERIHYLCSCIKGDASNALDHLAINQ